MLSQAQNRASLVVREANEYLQGNPLWIVYVKSPIDDFTIRKQLRCICEGTSGGLSGAVSLSNARALLKVGESHRVPLRREGLLSRDSQVVERKKAALKKARKAPQFSKR